MFEFVFLLFRCRLDRCLQLYIYNGTAKLLFYYDAFLYAGHRACCRNLTTLSFHKNKVSRSNKCKLIIHIQKSNIFLNLLTYKILYRQAASWRASWFCLGLRFCSWQAFHWIYWFYYCALYFHLFLFFLSFYLW